MRFTTNIRLLTAADETGAEFTIDQGGRFLLVATGTFDGATVALHLLGPDGTTFLAVPSASLTAAGTAVCYLPDNAVVKAVITSAGTTSIDAAVRRCPECCS